MGSELSEPERALVTSLSVFRGGFTRQAVQWVVGADPETRGLVADDLLERLVDRRVVVASADGTRFALGDTKGLASPVTDETLARHLDWARSYAEQGSAALDGPGQSAWLDALEADHDNFRAALEWGTARPDCEPALALAAALGRFWEVRRHVPEGRRWLATARQKSPNVAAAVRANAANSAGLLAFRDRDYSDAKTIYDESLALHWEIGDRLGSTGVLHALGNVAFQQRDWAEAKRLFEESLAIGRDLHDDRVVAASLANLGAVAETEGDRGQARRMYEEALDLWRLVGDNFNAAAVLANLADLAAQEGDLTVARRYAGETLEARRAVGDKAGMVVALRRLVAIAHSQGDIAAARAFADESKKLTVGGPKRPWWRRRGGE